ncbi:MAG: ABC transporter ATP-binding protein [Candidatus Sumerlaeaceae bacterium]|nr:ABC transporter ATP-binding protein [Candidatus Sumerlaeaceae bacterium]
MNKVGPAATKQKVASGHTGLESPPLAPVLQVEGLTVAFRTLEGDFRAVEGVSFGLSKGEKLGLVGESGCGKSVTALSIMRLLPSPPAQIVEGKIFFKGTELTGLGEDEMRKLRGDRLAMIFQEPMTALNPLHSIGDQIAEVLRIHKGLNRRDAWLRTVELLEKVQIPEAPKRARDYPHQLSGGMRQRAMIAMALACDPDLLIADEPTTALDVTVQAQILTLLENLCEEFDSSILLITHDMGIVAEVCDRVAIMYAGQIVETAEVDELFDRPLHPYTRGLLRSLPKIDAPATKSKLYSIPGSVPDPLRFPPGCRFHPRCEFATEECRKLMPEFAAIDGRHLVQCWHWERIEKAEGGA